MLKHTLPAARSDIAIRDELQLISPRDLFQNELGLWE